MKSFFCVLLLSASLHVYAQSISYSPYSVYGIGILKERTSVYNRALSETGIGIRDDFNLNILNPASYSSITSATQITELGMFYERARLNNSNSEATTSGGSLTAMSFWFRFSGKWAGTIGLSPFSTIKYDIIGSQAGVEGNETFIRYQGSGGLSQVYFGNGLQVTKNFSLGFNASYVFGNVIKEETILNGQASGLGVETQTPVRRAMFDVGLQYSVFLKKDRTITIGATAANSSRLNTSLSARVFQVDGDDSLFVAEIKTEDFIVPGYLGLGVSLNTRRHLLAADLKYKNWSNGVLDGNLKLTNTYRTSIGYEYKGNPVSDLYWDFVALRAGFYVQNNYFVLKDTPYNQWGFSVGAGLPLPGNRGTINISYNFNREGTLERQLIEQRAEVFVLDIVFRDLWGVRRKFD